MMKSENEKLRELLRNVIETSELTRHQHEELEADICAALSQQAEPAPAFVFSDSPDGCAAEAYYRRLAKQEEQAGKPCPTDAMLDEMRRNGLSIDGDNGYKRDLLDTVVGAMALGFQNTNPPPEGHWGKRFWDIGRAEGEAQEQLRAALATRPAQTEQQPMAVPVGFALVPARLTAENGAKGALSGEFSIQHETTCSACYFDEADDDCEVCGGEIQYVERITVPWGTIKEIYEEAVTAVAVPIAHTASNSDCEWCAGAGKDHFGEKCEHCQAAPQPEQSVLVAVLERIKKDTRSDDPLDHYEIVCRALSQYRAALAAHRAGGEA